MLGTLSTSSCHLQAAAKRSVDICLSCRLAMAGWAAFARRMVPPRQHHCRQLQQRALGALREAARRRARLLQPFWVRWQLEAPQRRCVQTVLHCGCSFQF